MYLDEVFRRYIQERKTGQIIIMFEGEDHLCKVSVEQGQAVYISMGRMDPEETLRYIVDKMPLEVNFIEGARAIRKLEIPLNARLFELGGHEIKSTAKIHGVKVEGTIDPEKVEALLEDFIDIVGPLGAAISDDMLARIGHFNGSPMNGGDYSALMSMCLEELPEEEREQFRKLHL